MKHSKEFHELMGLAKYGNEEQTNALLQALLIEKARRENPSNKP